MHGDLHQYCFPGFELQDYVKESIDFLQQNEPPEGYFVGFSGGKDSIVTLELCRMSGVKNVPHYSCTRIDPPEIVNFIRQYYPEVRWIYPENNIWKLIPKKGPPSMFFRWCCTTLKENPSLKLGFRHRIMGIRAEESIRRAQRPRISIFNRQVMYKPIFYWPEWAIWEFIDGHHLPYPSLYDEGFGRVGCCICPFIFGTKKLKRYMERWPTYWKTFKHSVTVWWKSDATQLRNSDFHLGRTAEEFWQTYINNSLLKRKQEKERLL